MISWLCSLPMVALESNNCIPVHNFILRTGESWEFYVSLRLFLSPPSSTFHLHNKTLIRPKVLIPWWSVEQWWCYVSLWQPLRSASQITRLDSWWWNWIGPLETVAWFVALAVVVVGKINSLYSEDNWFWTVYI